MQHPLYGHHPSRVRDLGERDRIEYLCIGDITGCSGLINRFRLRMPAVAGVFPTVGAQRRLAVLADLGVVDRDREAAADHRFTTASERCCRYPVRWIRPH